MWYTWTWAFHARSARSCRHGRMKLAARAHTEAPRSRRSSPFAYYVRRSWWASTRGICSADGHARRGRWGCSLGNFCACVHACKKRQECRPCSPRRVCCARIASSPSLQAASPRGLQGPSWAPRGSTSLSFSFIFPATHRARPIKKEIVAAPACSCCCRGA